MGETVNFTANYAYTNSNFVLQNMPTKSSESLSTDYDALFAVLKNLLQRGAIAELAGSPDHVGTPTRLSKYLEQESQIGCLTGDGRSDFKTPFYLVSDKPPVWYDTIKGYVPTQAYPARDFFNALPALLGEYGFAQQLICPEVAVADIVPVGGTDFVHQQVDFYCPPAKLIVEIDGFHHRDGIVKVKDELRDTFFEGAGIETIRIETSDWHNKTGVFYDAINRIKSRFREKDRALSGYGRQYKKQNEEGFLEDEIRYKLLPTAVLRFQLLLLELLSRGRLSLNSKAWKIIVFDSDGLSQQSGRYDRFAEMAAEDLFIWLEHLCALMSLKFRKPSIEWIRPKNRIAYHKGAVHVNFSLLQRYTDENKQHPDLIYVRTDYFSASQEKDGKNYFRVSTASVVPYNLENTPKTEKILEFFLENLFGKTGFRDGQLAIILNALNGRDTIGLLPTGGGKSLCYQLPCLLQPAISFVVCPIKALMYDQKDNLDKAFITRTNYITGELSPEVKATIQQQFADRRYFFIWISPERFQSKSFRSELNALHARTAIAYAVIDEVHCMSEWGHDFRTSYLNLTKTIHRFCPNTKLIGLTATASMNVLRDIRIEFARSETEFNDEDVKTKLDFARPELVFDIIGDGGNKDAVLTAQLKELQNGNEFLTPDTEGKAGLIFTPHANGGMGCYEQSNIINKTYTGKANWFAGSCPTKKVYVHIATNDFNDRQSFEEVVNKAIGYSMGEYEIHQLYNQRRELVWTSPKFLKPGYTTIEIKKMPIMAEKDFEEHKSRAQKDFKANKFPIMVATKAFGMGVDKQNICYTFHYGIPGSTESLYQEAGRAGRWDKRSPENEDREAVCRVLLTPETVDKEHLSSLFKPETSLAEVRRLSNLSTDTDHRAGDVMTQLFLFQNGYDEIDHELEVMQKLLTHILIQPKAPVVNVLYNTPSKRFVDDKEEGEDFYKMLKGMSTEKRKMATEKALYRLSILGYVQNWTTDFYCHFAVEFNVINEEKILKNLVRHLIKFKRDYVGGEMALQEEILKSVGTTLLEQCMRYLLNWTWQEIAYGRRTSLKTLYDLCIDFVENPDGANVRFKRSLDNYFRVDDTTIILQYITDQPKDFTSWQKAFQDKDGTYTLAFNEWKDRSDNLSRFLESGQYNLGRDAISGIFKLALGDYDHTDGRTRLEQTLSRLNEYFPGNTKQVLLAIVEIVKGLSLPSAARYKLANSIESHFPESYDWMSQELAIHHIPQLDALNKRVQTLNQAIHAELSRT